MDCFQPYRGIDAMFVVIISQFLKDNISQYLVALCGLVTAA